MPPRSASESSCLTAVAKGGHNAQSLNQSDADVTVTGDVVVLAVPYAALTDIVAQRGDSLPARPSWT